MDLTLNEIDRRVLGVLMEKDMSQPDYYPMRLNAVVAACNQKQNRDPVSSLDEVAVEAALGSLQAMGLVTMMFPAQGGRVKRYRHEVEQVCGWQKSERAVMSELLLRGPQTVGELRTRCQRFLQFADLEAVSLVLDRLGQLEPPLAQVMPREPGRSAVRYRHCLDAGDALQASTAERIEVSDAGVVRDQAPDLQAEIAALRREIADLRERISTIEEKGSSD